MNLRKSWKLLALKFAADHLISKHKFDITISGRTMVATQTPILLFVNVQNEKTFRDRGSGFVEYFLQDFIGQPVHNLYIER